MNDVLVSIIIPVYNGENWMRKCIESAINQTYKNIEIIIVDDGSTDNTEEISKEYEKIDSRIKYIKKTNGGQSTARNLGIDLSSGKYIQFLDCDDFLDEKTIELTMNAINLETNISFVLYGLNIWQADKLLRKPHAKKGMYSISEGYEKFSKILKLMSSPCNKLYKKEYIKYKFDESCVFAEDSIFNYINLEESTVISAIEDCLYNVSLSTPSSVNKRYRKGKLKDALKSLQIEESKLKELFDEKFDLNAHKKNVLSTMLVIVKSNNDKNTFNDMCDELFDVKNTEYFKQALTVSKNMKSEQKILLKLIIKENKNMLYVFCKILQNLRKLRS